MSRVVIVLTFFLPILASKTVGQTSDSKEDSENNEESRESFIRRLKEKIKTKLSKV